MTWAQRLQRVFNIDVSVCPRCGGEAKVIASASARGAFSAANKAAVQECKKCQTTARQATAKIGAAEARIAKAMESAKKAVSAKQKALAKTRLAAAKLAAREAKAAQRAALKAEKDAIAVLAKLEKLHEKAHAGFLRAHERAAAAIAKAKPKKKRASKKKAAAKG